MPSVKIPTMKENAKVLARDLTMRIGMEMLEQLRRTGQSFETMAEALGAPEETIRVVMKGILEGANADKLSVLAIAELCVAADMVLGVRSMSTDEFIRSQSFPELDDDDQDEDEDDSTGPALEGHEGTEH